MPRCTWAGAWNGAPGTVWCGHPELIQNLYIDRTFDFDFRFRFRFLSEHTTFQHILRFGFRLSFQFYSIYFTRPVRTERRTRTRHRVAHTAHRVYCIPHANLLAAVVIKDRAPSFEVITSLQALKQLSYQVSSRDGCSYVFNHLLSERTDQQDIYQLA